MTLYAVDPSKQELYSNFLALDTVKESACRSTRKSVAGFVAATGQDRQHRHAYDKAELMMISPTLSFDGSWDKKTGFRTKQNPGHAGASTRAGRSA